MLLFDTDFADDDLKVLSEYARAQDVAEAARKTQQQQEPSGEDSTSAGDEPDDLEGASWAEAASDGAGVATLESKTTARRICTWVSRLREVDGVPADRMAPIHGRLIAHGLLQFQLQGREDGVVYRVTSAGRQMLNTPSAEAA